MSDNLKTKAFKYKSATAHVFIYPNGEVWIYEVKAKRKRQGHGSGLMKKISKWADKKGYTLRLQANRYGKNSFSTNKELAEFYKAFGFKVDGDQPVFMTR